MRFSLNFKTLCVLVSTMFFVSCSCSTAKNSLSKVKQDADKEINKLMDQKAEISADKMDGKKMGERNSADVKELEITDIKVGEGDEAMPGATVEVHYVGTLLNGTKFDSSRDRGQGFSFPLGAGKVIKGWDEGVKGMKVGGMRKLVIPSDMAYGPRAMGDVIPANSALVFEVELLKVSKPL